MEFGEFLKVRRLERKMSIRKLAMYAQCSDSYLSLLERGLRGRKGPTPDFLRKLEKPLQVPFEVLMSAAGYTLQTNDEWIYSGSMVHMLRSALGDEIEEFAEKVELNPNDIEAIEQHGIGYRTYEGILEKLFVSERVLTSKQKELLQRLKHLLPKIPVEKSNALESLINAFFDMIGG